MREITLLVVSVAVGAFIHPVVGLGLFLTVVMLVA